MDLKITRNGSDIQISRCKSTHVLQGKILWTWLDTKSTLNGCDFGRNFDRPTSGKNNYIYVKRLFIIYICIYIYNLYIYINIYIYTMYVYVCYIYIHIFVYRIKQIHHEYLYVYYVYYIHCPTGLVSPPDQWTPSWSRPRHQCTRASEFPRCRSCTLY